MGGRNSLPNENIEACEYRNEPACIGLQFKIGNADNRDKWAIEAVGA